MIEHGWNEAVFGALNALSGRSYTLDTLIALAAVDPVVKAGPIIACFAYAWWKSGEAGDRQRRRSILLVTLAAMFVIAPTMKIVSTESFSPRPLLRSETVYLYNGDQLGAQPRLAYRAPLTGDARGRYEELAAGNVDANDFASFPSDHAALFLALALGIFLASRMAGSIALAWATVVTLGTRIVTGMHAPVDIVVGGAIGMAMLMAILALVRALPVRVRDYPLMQIERFPGLSAALIVVALLEVANAMNTLKRLFEIASSALANLS